VPAARSYSGTVSGREVDPGPGTREGPFPLHGRVVKQSVFP
jgi:hypothetical protein